MNVDVDVIELHDDAVRVEQVGIGLLLRRTPLVQKLLPGQLVLHNDRVYRVTDGCPEQHPDCRYTHAVGVDDH